MRAVVEALARIEAGSLQVGAVQNIVSKGSKYALFDPCKLTSLFTEVTSKCHLGVECKPSLYS